MLKYQLVESWSKFVFVPFRFLPQSKFCGKNQTFYNLQLNILFYFFGKSNTTTKIAI